MRAVVQRVSRAQVLVKEEIVGEVGSGLVIFLGVGTGDTSKDVDYLADKILNLRIFADEEDKMNLSPLEVGADLLVVPEFTLYGDCAQGRRPSFDQAASAQKAEKLYKKFVNEVKKSDLAVDTGQFKTKMSVNLTNQGPVTMLINTD